VQVEIQDIVKIGYLNGLFVLARSIGLIGHALDQKRLQQPLYRHPWDEVMLPQVHFMKLCRDSFTQIMNCLPTALLNLTAGFCVQVLYTR
jgi:hypothetical protein